MTEFFNRLASALERRYSIVKEIGRGGAAIVYLADDVRHGRKVAVKVLRPELSAALGAERFLREIEIAAGLNHPHILPLHDSGEADGLLYYVMPYVEGESLRGRLRRERQLGVEEAVRITLEVASALSFAHANDIVHRDIKPENILLAAGIAVVADFGIGRAISEATEEKLTSTGLAVGTPAYMSTEQANGEQVLDGRSDIYSLGCVLYEMLAGETPYTGGTAQAIIARKLVEPVPSLRTVRDTVPEPVEHAVLRSLAKVPADRFATASQFADALVTTEVYTVAGTGLPVTGTVPTGRRGRLTYAGLAVGVALVAALSFFVGRGPVADAGPSTPRLVVLPFEHLGVEDDEYFTEGMTEEITSRLGQIGGLGVIARTSALQYKSTTKTVLDIGAELAVDYVLAGTVRWQRGDDELGEVRVTPHLTRVTDNTELWTDTYDAEVASIFDVQSSIAENVAQALGVALLLQDAGTEPLTSSPEAYDYYLRGKAHDRRAPSSREDAQLAIDSYRLAVQADSMFAEAYAAVARSHVYRPFNWSELPSEVTQAKAALDRAVALAPERTSTYIAQGYYHYYGLGDYEEALRFFGKALDREPNNVEVMAAMGWVHRRQGEWDLAVDRLTEAFELDPRDYSLANGLGRTFMRLRRFSEAERYFGHAVTISPDLLSTYRKQVNLHLLSNPSLDETIRFVEDIASARQPDWLFATDPGAMLRISALATDLPDRLRTARGREPSAIPLDRYWRHVAEATIAGRHGQEALERSHYDSLVVALEQDAATESTMSLQILLAYGYAGLGRKDAAIELGRRAVAEHPFSEDALTTRPLEFLARIYTMVGEYDAAIDQLEELLSIPSLVSPAMLRVDRAWDPLRDHVRFQRLASRGD